MYSIIEIDKDLFLVEQGHLMTPASPGVITVKLNLNGQKITRLMAGGEAKVIKSMTVSI